MVCLNVEPLLENTHRLMEYIFKVNQDMYILKVTDQLDYYQPIHRRNRVI